MNKYIAHFATVTKHRAVVFHQCRNCGLFWQGLTHDLSKYSPVEFFTSARYFQGDKSPIEAEKAATGYSAAWLHHKGHNRHHWEYWTDYADDGSVIAHRMPYRFVVEMVCDWVGAGMVYNKDQWTPDEPIAYYYRVRKGRHFNPKTEELTLRFLQCIQTNGLDEFYKMARCELPYTFLKLAYEKDD